MTERVRIATWNLEWARPGGLRARLADATLAAYDVDVLCLTEAHLGNLPMSAADGVTAPPGRTISPTSPA